MSEVPNCCKESVDLSLTEDPFQNNREEFKKFLECQKLEMEKFKWIVSESKGYDVGSEALKIWICKYAKDFRYYYCNEVLKKAQNPELS